MRWLDDFFNSMDMSLSKLQKTVKDRKASVLQSMELQNAGHNRVTGNKSSIVSKYYHTYTDLLIDL